MPITRIEKDRWQEYFDAMSKALQASSRSQYAEVRVFSPEFGEQRETSWLPFEGITYDRHNDLVDLAVSNMNHLIRRPAEIYADEDSSGVIFGIQIRCADGTKEVIELR
jgi:hypothetical protein